MNKLVAIAGICLFLGFPQLSKAQNTAFEPGKVWNDTEGNPINAHGGGILYHEGTYYWYGEYKKGKTVLNGIARMGYVGVLPYRCDGS